MAPEQAFVCSEDDTTSPAVRRTPAETVDVVSRQREVPRLRSRNHRSTSTRTSAEDYILSTDDATSLSVLFAMTSVEPYDELTAHAL